MNPRIPGTRGIAREGVNAAQALFERAGCVFQEVAQQNDFGKDAYVDIAERGVVTHLCVALQIKSRESFRLANGDYSVPIEKHASTWRHSTVPVFGLVFDPKDRLLRWADLTGYLRKNPHQETGNVPVSRASVLTEQTLRSEFRAAVSEYAGSVSAGAITLKLLSTSEPLQADAVFDAWALGRHDARYLILLRRLVLELRPRAARRAIAALSHAAPHPDILWTKDNWIPPEVESQVHPSFRWSPEELVYMLGVLETEEWGRGTLGQCLDVLLYEDPNVVPKLRIAIGFLLADGDTTRAVRAATVLFAHSHDARGELSHLLATHPRLAEDEWFEGVSEAVREDGHFSLY